MASAVVHYYFSTRHPRKPFRIEVEVSGEDVSYTLDVHGRFQTQRLASEVGRNIGCLFTSYTEEWGRVIVQDGPIQFETID